MSDHHFVCGRWQDNLKTVEVNSLVMDPPYSERTVKGRRTGSDVRQSGIDYKPLTEEDVLEFVFSWHKRVSDWWVIFGDHITMGWWSYHLSTAGLYVFAPTPWVKPDAAPRMAADGPAMASEPILIARTPRWPRRRQSRPGFYYMPTASTRGNGGAKSHPGAKPIGLISQILRDYSEPGDLICDPFSGSGTTMLAALSLGRKFIGCEQDPATFRKAKQRLLASTLLSA